jgi:radical SAM protein with 4Fe4S-binding SPASM domain
MPDTIAIILADASTTRFGLPSMLSRDVAGRNVLSHTVARARRIEGVRGIAVVHPADQDLASLVDDAGDVTFVPISEGWTDRYTAMCIAARKWSLTAWRGGLAGATCYDELLLAKPVLQAFDACNASAGVLLGGDWMLLDPAITGKVLALHLQYPQAMPMTFCQAPPGLAGLAVSRTFIDELAKNPSSSIGQVLAYVPTHPQADPIGKDVCVQIPANVRNTSRRYICDTSRGAAMIDALAARLGDVLATADGSLIADTVREIEAEAPDLPLPQQVTLELTPQREVNGPIVPQHYVTLSREAMDVEAALAIVEQLGRAGMGDTALTLGGLGDALLYEGWRTVVDAAKAAGVLGICIETDLLVDQQTLRDVLDAGVDVVSVRLNADTPETYAKVMGVDRYKTVLDNLQFLFDQRQRRAVSGGLTGLPWIVPRLVKTADTLGDMEDFFDKWVHYLGHAVIEPATSGAGQMPELSPVNMAAPQRRPCRQVTRRLTVLSNGCVAQCDQDWQGQAAAGDTARQTLADIWKQAAGFRKAQQDGRWNELELCRNCHEWHRP